MKRRRLSSAQLILLSFLAVILLGTALLCLPFASHSGTPCAFTDALFTATSATCVTGLIVFDTATHWTLFGKLVLICLIQIGGMGVVTVAGLLISLSGKKIGIFERSTLQQAISAPRLDGLLSNVRRIVRAAFLFELVGALCLLPSFCAEFGLTGIPMALFHSVSAFCNAGFDLMGSKAPFSSLTSYAGNGIVNTVIMLLILIGGIGFTTWADVRKHGLRLRRYSAQSKLILVTSLLLIVLPSAYFYFAELTDLSGAERLFASLFQSVTMRTAGFNTVELDRFSETGRVLMILLMLIGGASGSTAGGMKLTTVAILAVAAFSVFRQRKQTAVFGRRIPEELIKQSAAIFFLYIAFALLGAAVISRLEELPYLTCLFETASAAATVGVSLGITPALCTLSKLILIFLMFFGRLGGLTLIFAAFSDDRCTASFPQETMSIG